ncbi:MAG: hypothetical protein M0Z51_15260 [Propionibacterium sp.]|nr:hypothetical protein [Propionibacterium sp.]
MGEARGGDLIVSRAAAADDQQILPLLRAALERTDAPHYEG